LSNANDALGAACSVIHRERLTGSAIYRRVDTPTQPGFAKQPMPDTSIGTLAANKKIVFKWIGELTILESTPR
jgi:hypothetical protein